jgi:hypothetical protein
MQYAFLDRGISMFNPAGGFGLKTPAHGPLADRTNPGQGRLRTGLAG